MEADDGERRRVQLADSELADHVTFAARHTARIDLQLHLSTGSGGPLIAHLQQKFVPGGALGGHGA